MKPRVVFFGTPEIAIPSLQVTAQHADVVACVTQPDKPSGRGNALTTSPVKRWAELNHIPVLQPHSLSQKKNEGVEFAEQFRALQPDCAVVFAYGHIIPESILAIPPHGFLNLHPSLLPELRGPSPIQAAIRNGLTKSGVSLIQMSTKMDAGPIIAQQTVSLDPHETAASLYDTMKQICADVLEENLLPYLEGHRFPQQQDEASATYCSLLKKTDGEVDWTRSYEEIDRQIRSMSPWPGAYAICNGRRILIAAAELENGILRILRVKPEGKKEMAYDEFIRGYPDCQLPPQR